MTSNSFTIIALYTTEYKAFTEE